MLLRLMLAMALVAALVLGCKEESGGQDDPDPPPPVEHCGVEGSVETTVFDGVSTYIDVPSTPLRVEPDLQIFEEDLSWNVIEVGGSGFWSITGSLRWTGQLYLDTVTGLESGVPHTARIFYQLNTGDLAGLVFVPVEPEDAQGTIPAMLWSEYNGGASRTRYAFGITPDYIQTGTEVAIDWHYFAATDELVFEGIGSLDLEGVDPTEGWEPNPVVTICLSTVDVPPDEPSPVFAGVGVIGLGVVGLALKRRRGEG